jgi:hypothetical protein
MKKEYLILLIVIIAGLIAIFSLSFLMVGDENLTGAAASAWGGGGKSCQGADQSCCKEIYGICDSDAKCRACGGKWE